ncbi:MAG: hypothetical protein SGJ27_02005 [Candidatus Melainabacteria bacterium]|mgnify:CR=1 FL=1|nr:hypothetical protein [Candidatus Melainabacteria bacterium]
MVIVFIFNFTMFYPGVNTHGEVRSLITIQQQPASNFDTDIVRASDEGMVSWTSACQNIPLWRRAVPQEAQNINLTTTALRNNPGGKEAEAEGLQADGGPNHIRTIKLSNQCYEVLI